MNTDIHNLLTSMNLKEVLHIKTELKYKINDLSKKYSYWEVDSSSWDERIAEYFKKGYLILRHKITIDSIAVPIEEFKALDMSSMGFYPEYFDLENTIRHEFFDKSEKIEESGKLSVGYMFHLPCADGAANYMVTKVTPKTVSYQTIRFGDGYVDRVLGCEGRLSMDKFKSVSRWGCPTLASIFGKR